MKTFITLLAIFVFPIMGFSATHDVPDDFTTIQEAIDTALGGDTIIVRPDTYVENIDFLGKAITVTSEQGPDVTIIDGGQPTKSDFGSVVIFKNGEGSDSVLEGFAITNGSGSLGITGYYYGGGIFCDATSPTIKNNVISGNAVSGHPYHCGGGIYCRLGTPTITDNTISENTASGEGGGIFCIQSSPRIENNTVTKNGAEVWGGGIEFVYDCSPTIMNNMITDNTASQYDGGGGGIVLGHNCSGIIMNNTISGNTAVSGEGGGIAFCDGCSPRIENNIITHNWAYRHGSGIEYWDNCAPTILNNIIMNNTTSQYDGGGITMGTESSGIIMNNLISENAVGRSGGGVYCGMYCFPILMNNTIYGNIANSNGGGIYTYDNWSLTVTNTILWNNDAASGPEIWIGDTLYPSTLTISYSDVEGGQASVFVDSGCTLNWGPGMIDVDPLFVTGPEGDYYLSQIAAGQVSDSPCVDTGSNLAMNLNMHTCWTRTDEVPDSGVVDMGFHYGLSTPPTLSVEPYQIPESTGGASTLSLSAGIENANRNYFVLGSVSGTEPGTSLPGGLVTLPLNWDVFTNIVINMINGPLFLNFAGSLDADGLGTATFNLPAGSGATGLTMYYAYTLKPYDFVSNPVAVEIVQ